VLNEKIILPYSADESLEKFVEIYFAREVDREIFNSLAEDDKLTLTTKLTSMHNSFSDSMKLELAWKNGNLHVDLTKASIFGFGHSHATLAPMHPTIGKEDIQISKLHISNWLETINESLKIENVRGYKGPERDVGLKGEDLIKIEYWTGVGPRVVNSANASKLPSSYASDPMEAKSTLNTTPQDLPSTATEIAAVTAALVATTASAQSVALTATVLAATPTIPVIAGAITLATVTGIAGGFAIGTACLINNALSNPHPLYFRASDSMFIGKIIEEATAHYEMSPSYLIKNQVMASPLFELPLLGEEYHDA